MRAFCFLNVETFGTGKVADSVIVDAIDSVIVDAIDNVFDLRPGAIIRDLGRSRPIYLASAAYDHFARHDIDLPWEATNRVARLA